MWFLLYAVACILAAALTAGALPAGGKADIDAISTDIIACIQAEDFQKAQSQCIQMITRFAASLALPQALYNVADEYGNAGKYEDANQMYEIVFRTVPGTALEARAQLGAQTAYLLQLIQSKEYWPAELQLRSLRQTWYEHPDWSERLYSVARRYAWCRQYKQAKELFAELLVTYPQSAYCDDWELWSRRVDICLLINDARDAQIPPAFDGFLKDFAQRGDLAEMFYWICKEYEWARSRLEDRRTRYDVCLDCYRQLADRFPASPFAEKAAHDVTRLSHRARIFTLIEDGNDAQVDAAVDAMVADMNGQAGGASELYWAAIEYELYQGGQRPAKRLMQQISDECPDSDEARNCRIGVLRMDILDFIDAEDINGAERAIDAMITDFAGHPHLQENLHRIAKAYYEIADGCRTARRTTPPDQSKELEARERKYFALARNLYQKAIDHLAPVPPYTPAEYYFAGVCEKRLGNYQRAVDYFNVVVNDWPDYEHAGGAQCEIAWSYEAMARNGELSESQCRILREQAYKKAADEFRGTSWAAYAAKRLGDMYFDESNTQEALRYYNVFLKEAEPEDSRIRYVKTRIDMLQSGESAAP